MDEYNNAQDKWIGEGLNRIRNVSANRKKLSKSFLEFAKRDLDAYELLKKNSLCALVIFHLQQAAEKIDKATLI